MHRSESLTWSLSIPITRRHALIAGGIAGAALATALAAHVRIPLPFSPVPVTLQTMVVLLSGAVLGAVGGTLSQILYLALGSAGVATFAGGALTGVTGGYLIGFVVAAGIVGAVARRTDSMLAVGAAMVAGEAAILALGAAWLAHVNGLSVGQALVVGVLPFLPGDAIKLAGALGVWKVGRVAWRALIEAGRADE
ncbi:MAG: biotin transporter BioY [Armatimonadota bacterium]|nr:biotin transporter BioY [Armatimonadota bacterium]